MNIVLCLEGYALISLLFWAFSGFAYYVNSKQATGDPAKRDFHPAAIFMAPFWPMYLLFAAFLAMLSVIALAVFLVAFTAALVLIRKPFILVWLKKIALKIGNKLLQINTFLIRLFIPSVKPKTT
ncbi:MAG: hypothetical protein IPP66_12245 [Anaerolineales bacterium]|nr:hypothetical protein [Anaerolineales bacterium]